jgi:putative nucleotidyltransferase with HDIG domain
MADHQAPYHVVIDQLRIGMFVILDVKWLEHDFPRSSFKIAHTSQIEAIKRLGLKVVRVDPERSSGPLPPQDSAPPPSARPEINLAPTAEVIAALEAKRARIERINRQRAAVVECERQFVKSATTLKNINTNIFARPQEAHREANELVGKMMDSLLTAKDIAIHLMHDKIGGEDLYFHALNVTVMALMLAKEIHLPEAEVRELGIGSLFHDIGKLDIPDRILMKTSGLTTAEKHLLEQHCAYGIEIGKKMGLSKQALEVIAQHHECIDGSGYPQHLDDDRMSPLARVTAIVNAYDNMCNRPNPTDSVSPYAALSHMFARQRGQFDPTALGVFIKCLGVYPPGTLVRLSDGTMGMVVAINSAKPLKPSVLIYEADVPKNEAIVIDLDQEPELSVRESLKPTELPREVYDYLSPRKRMTYYFDVPSDDRKPGS